MSTVQMNEILDADEFREILELSHEEQRSLLRSDDPRYRIWAAWALGLELAGEFAGPAREMLASEPVAGVRRHLVVMMAGFGEVDIVAALARHDPDEFVRSTAARYAAELSSLHPELADVLRDCLDDTSFQVQRATLERLPEDAPDDLWERARELARGGDVELRRATLRRLASVDPPDSILLERLRDEPVGTIRRQALKSLLDTVGLRPLYDRARSEGWVDRLLEDLSSAEMTFDWSELETLDDHHRLLRLVDPAHLPTTGRCWLLGLPRSHRAPLLLAVEKAYRGRDAVASDEERDALREFLKRLDDELQQRGVTDDSDGEGELVEWGTLFPSEPLEYRVRTHLRELSQATSRA